MASGDVTGKINLFVCSNQHLTITVNVDDGILPFSIPCPEGCGATARNMGYHIDQTATPAYQWYKPTPEEADALPNEWERIHAKSGGLLLQTFEGTSPAITYDLTTPIALDTFNGALIVKLNELLNHVSSVTLGSPYDTWVDQISEVVSDRVTSAMTTDNYNTIDSENRTEGGGGLGGGS